MLYDETRNTRVTKLPKVDKETNLFLKDLKIKCEATNVELIFLKEDVVYFDADDTLGAKGWFDVSEDGKGAKLICSISGEKESWLTTLVHESCHLDQWVDDLEQWDRLSDSFSYFWDWLEGNIELDECDLIQYTREVQLLELDCESRAIQKIKQYNLPIDVIEYTQKACTYIYSYNRVRKKRKWWVGKYSIVDLWSAAPTTLPFNITKTPKKLNKKFKKYFK